MIKLGFILTFIQIIITKSAFVRYNGYVVDYYCWQLPGRIGLDGARLGTNPGAHTTHCMRDVAPCIANGYIVLEPKVNGQYTYDLKYRFDSAGNSMMFNIVDRTSKFSNLRVTVSGEEMPNNYIAVQSLVLEDFIPGVPSALPTPLPGSPTARPTNASELRYPPSEIPSFAPSTQPLIQGNGISHSSKVATGILVGFSGVLAVLISMYTFAFKAEHGDISPTDFSSNATIVAAFLTVIASIISIILMSYWTQEPTANDINYLGRPNWNNNAFAYHPVLMTCFVAGQLLAICVWSLIPWGPVAKIIHAALQTGSLVCMILGFVAIVKDRKDAQLATFTTIHSWLGIAAICIFGLAYMWGILMGLLTASFSQSSFTISHRAGMRYFHRNFAVLSVLLCVIAVTTGFMDHLSEGLCFYKLESNEIYGEIKDSADHYKAMPESCKVAYGSCVAIVVAVVLAMWAVMNRGGGVMIHHHDEDELDKIPAHRVAVPTQKIQAISTDYRV